MNRRPNIVFFFADDQRYNTIRALGNRQAITPNIDRLVREGTAFTNSYIMGGTVIAVCMPSRAMLHTGRTLYRIQKHGKNIPEDHALLGETLRGAGYDTFGTGKWHNGTRAYHRSFTHGGEIFFGGMDDHWNVPVHSFDPTGEYPNRREVRKEFCTSWMQTEISDHVAAGKHSSELFCDEAIRFLDERKSKKPFFMYVSFMAPHDPRTMPQKYLEMYADVEIELPENYLPEHPFDNGILRVRDELLAEFPRSPAEVRRHLKEYYAMITHLDAEMGRVMAKLEAMNEYQNTIFVFAGDNGLAVGCHGLMGKQNLYEHSIKVPLIFAGPGIPQGETRGTFAYLLDIFPTLCSITEVPVPDTVEGRSLLPALEDSAEPLRESLYFMYHNFQRAIRCGDHKLIEYAVDGVRTTQLFNLSNDPHEMDNLAEDPACGEIIERLREEMINWRDEIDDTQEGQGAVFWAAF